MQCRTSTPHILILSAQTAVANGDVEVECLVGEEEGDKREEGGEGGEGGMTSLRMEDEQRDVRTAPTAHLSKPLDDSHVAMPLSTLSFSSTIMRPFPCILLSLGVLSLPSSLSPSLPLLSSLSTPQASVQRLPTTSPTAQRRARDEKERGLTASMKDEGFKGGIDEVLVWEDSSEGNIERAKYEDRYPLRKGRIKESISWVSGKAKAKAMGLERVSGAG